MKALVIDGYNAIHKIQRIKQIADKSLQDARAAITELAREYKRLHGGIAELSVVFDGRDEYRRHFFDALPNQIFSRTGDGDNKIVRTVEKLAANYDVIVVSDDNYVRNNSRAHGATVISIAELVSTVESKRPAKAEGASDKNLSAKDMRDITDYLKKQWNV